MVNVLNGTLLVLLQHLLTTVIANAPTASRHVLVSTPDRHLVFFGTETTVGDPATQDDMFIRFSDQKMIKQILILCLPTIQQNHKDLQTVL